MNPHIIATQQILTPHKLYAAVLLLEFRFKSVSHKEHANENRINTLQVPHHLEIL